MKKSNLLILSVIVSLTSLNNASAFERRDGGRGGEQNQDTTGERGGRGERGDRGGQPGERGQGQQGERSGDRGDRGPQSDRGSRGGDLPPVTTPTPSPTPQAPPVVQNPPPVVTTPRTPPAQPPVVTTPAPSVPARGDDRDDRFDRGPRGPRGGDRQGGFGGRDSRDDNRFGGGDRFRDGDRFGRGDRDSRYSDFGDGPRGHRPPPPRFEPNRGGDWGRGPGHWERRRANHQWSMGVRFRDRAPRWNNNWTNWNRNWESRQRFIQNRRPVRFSHMRWNSYWRMSLNVTYGDYVFYPPYPRYNDDFYYAESDWNGYNSPQAYYMEADVEEYLNIRSSPNANGSYNICGQLPAGAVVPVVSTLRPAFGGDRVWAMIRVDMDVRDYITNPDCFRSPYVFTSMDYLK